MGGEPVNAAIVDSPSGPHFEADDDNQPTNLIIGPRLDGQLRVGVYRNTYHALFDLTIDDEATLLAYLQHRAAVRDDSRTEELADAVLVRFGEGPSLQAERVRLIGEPVTETVDLVAALRSSVEAARARREAIEQGDL
jgi:hypothetical protein